VDSRAHLRRESFDEVAELYAVARPGYPRTLVDELTRRAALGPHSRVLEVGCGPGLMTLPIAETGARIVALELGSRLAEVARRNLARFDGVEVVQGDFDVWMPPSAAFDAVLVATAFHWLDPATRIDRCATALRPGGTLAIVETHWGVGSARDRFSIESQACYARWDPEHEPYFVPPALEDLPQRHAELDACARFEQAQLMRFSVERTYRTDEYRRLMETWSAVRALELVHREGLLTCMASLIDDRFAGAVPRTDSYSLWLTRRVS
jgi:protein-L-isoaspartate O-methyltransferase